MAIARFSNSSLSRLRPAAAAPVAAATPADEVVDLQEDEIEEQNEAENEVAISAETETEVATEAETEVEVEEPAAPVAKPVLKPVPAKTAVPAAKSATLTKTAAPKPAAKTVPVKTAAPKPAAEEEVAVASEPPAAKRHSKKAAAIAAAVTEMVAQTANLAAGIKLPEPGSRISKDADLSELYLAFWHSNRKTLDRIRAESGDAAYALAMMRLPFDFLLGDLESKAVGECSVEAFKTVGGLAQHYNVSVMPGVYFKVEDVNRTYPNPRADRSDPNSPTAMRVEGRRVIDLRVQVSDGVTIPGRLDADGNFVAA